MKGTPGNVLTVALSDAQMVLFARATVQAMLDNIQRGGIDAPQPAVAAGTVPRIGQPWPGQGGIYAGTVRGDEGQPDYHLILAEPDREKIKWNDATAWAISLKADGHSDFTLPTRREQAILFGNVKDRFAEAWYWSGEQHASFSDSAWVQTFNTVCDKVARSRIERAKGMLECVVVEHDWPEYAPTWAAIEKRCTPEKPRGKPCPNCNPTDVFNYGDERCELCHGEAYLPAVIQ